MKLLPVSEYISDRYYDDLQRPQGEPDLVWLSCLQLLSSWRPSQSQSRRQRPNVTQSLAIVNQSTYREPTEPLFIKLNTLIFKTEVDLQTLQIIHKANQHQLPHSVKKWFRMRENKRRSPGNLCCWQKQLVRTNTRTRCTSVNGVNLWNSCRNAIKTCTSLSRFKSIDTINGLDMNVSFFGASASFVVCFLCFCKL